MDSKGTEPQNPGGQGWQARGDSPVSRGQVPDLDLLKKMLQKVLAAPNPAEMVLPEDLEALMEVARSHRGEPFELVPVSVDLVQAILKSFFKIQGNAQNSWRIISTKSRISNSPSRRGRSTFFRHETGR